MFRGSGQLLAQLTCLINTVLIGSVAVAIGVGVVAVFGLAAFEPQTIKSGRVSVGGLEIPHEVTLIIKSDLVRNLLHTQET